MATRKLEVNGFAFVFLRKLTSTPSALPFSVTPEQAMRRLGIWGSVLGSTNKILESTVAALTNVDVDFLKPDRFAAVYVPVWDVFWEFTVDAQQRKTSPALFQCLDIIIPGCDVPFLSTMFNASLRPVNQRLDLVPFEESLTRQHGMDVQCVPFSTSPFSLYNLLDTFPEELSLYGASSTTLFPKTLETNLFAAFPILVPMYMAQYDAVDGQPDKGSVTMVMEGHHQEYYAVFEPVPPPILPLQGTLSNFILDTQRRFQENIRKGRILKRVRASLPLLTTVPMLETLSLRLGDPEFPSTLGSYPYLENDDDPRIREANPKEIDDIFMYLMTAGDTIQALSNWSATLNATMSTDPDQDILRKRLAELREERAESVPSWWQDHLSRKS